MQHVKSGLFNTELTCCIYTPKVTLDNPDPVAHYTTFSNNRIICGQMKVGPLVEKEVRDTEKKESYYLDRKNAVLDPFFFLIYLPQYSDMGVLLLEREMPNVEYVFGRILLNNFVLEKINGELQINVQNFIPKDFVKTLFTEGDLEELTLTSNVIPPDVAQRIGVFMTEDEKIKCKIIITPEKGLKQKAREQILNILDYGFHAVFGVQEETWGDNENMDIKILSRLNGQEKKISLKNPYKFRPYYKIPVSLNSNFETDYKDIKTTSLNYLKEHVNPLLEFDEEDSN